jgi:hypothetical protein
VPKNSKARNVRVKHRKAQAKLKERERLARAAAVPPPVVTPPARSTSRARTQASTTAT